MEKNLTERVLSQDFTKKYQEYNKYDEVVQIVSTNILVEFKRCGAYILCNFDENDDAHKLYFNITSLMSAIDKKVMYLDMPLWKYLIFKFKRRKTHQNLRWLSLIKKIRIEDGLMIPISEIMNFIKSELQLDEDIFEKVNNTYYG